MTIRTIRSQKTRPKSARIPKAKPAINHEPAASQRAYDWTKSKILIGTYAGGELICEGEIAESLSVSRTPVREAFLRLQAEGLLKLYPKKGAMVVPVSNHEIEMVFETRMVLEQFAVRKILATDMGTRIAESIECLITKQLTALEAHDFASFVSIDRETHGRLLQSCANSILFDLYMSMRDRQLRMGNVMLYLSPSRARDIIAQHQELARLFRAGDLEALLMATATHIKDSRDALILYT